MARILMCWELGNGLAYIEGLAAMARWGRARSGHEFVFALRDLSHAERLLGDKFTFYQAPTQVIPLSTPLPSPMTFADVLINLGYGDSGNVTARVRAWRNLIGHVKPDIMRCAHAPGALLAARGTGIRTISSGIGFLLPPAMNPLPNLRSWNKGAVPERMAAREAQVLGGMNQSLDAISAPQLENVGALYNEADVRELFTYPELDDYGHRDNVTYLGNLQSASGDAPTWPTTSGKRIFAYLEAFKPIPQVLKALADTGQPVLVYLPHAPEQLRTQYAGSNLLLTDRPLNITETVAQCDIGVDHGGHNIAGSFLQAGKPQLCIPTVFPERVTAEKLVGLGVGLMSAIEATESGKQLGRLLHEPGFTSKAQECRARLARYTMDFAMNGTLQSVEALTKSS